MSLELVGISDKSESERDREREGGQEARRKGALVVAREREKAPRTLLSLCYWALWVFRVVLPWEIHEANRKKKSRAAEKIRSAWLHVLRLTKLSLVTLCQRVLDSCNRWVLRFLALI